MAEIKYRVCDMCGKEIDATYFLAKIKKTRKISISLIRRVARVFDTEHNYEFCIECGAAVQAFIIERAAKSKAQTKQDSQGTIKCGGDTE